MSIWQFGLRFALYLPLWSYLTARKRSFGSLFSLGWTWWTTTFVMSNAMRSISSELIFSSIIAVAHTFLHLNWIRPSRDNARIMKKKEKNDLFFYCPHFGRSTFYRKKNQSSWTLASPAFTTYWTVCEIWQRLLVKWPNLASSWRKNDHALCIDYFCIDYCFARYLNFDVFLLFSHDVGESWTHISKRC